MMSTDNTATFSTSILAFGIMRDIVGGSTLNYELTEGTTVVQLTADLQRQFPKITELRSFLIAVNNEYGDANLVIERGDEIALIPPVSGG